MPAASSRRSIAATRRNVALLREHGYTLIGPESGWQACRMIGPGRMSAPETILAEVERQLRSAPPKARA